MNALIPDIDRDVRLAVARGQLDIEFQPIFTLSTGEVGGCEALVRWNHPQLGRLLPSTFIHIAETNGAIVEIGEWVLDAACQEAMAWPGDIWVAVNVSAVQLRSPSFLSTVRSVLHCYGLPANRLEIEITESVLVDDARPIEECIASLREMGVRIALDDFGTGFCSFDYVRRLQFDKIKVDRLFTQPDLKSRAVLRAIARLGNMLGAVTTAEGVETSEQLSRATSEGCTEAQGTLLGSPQSAETMHALLVELAEGTAAPSSAPAVASTLYETESARQRALYVYNILDSKAEESFDRVARLAMQMLDAPFAMVSLIDGDRQWVNSKDGYAIDETAGSNSMCTYTMGSPAPLVVKDALSDRRFNRSPLVTGPPGIRSFIGVPLRTHSGHNVGALCITDVRTREVSSEQVAILEDLGRLVIDELELRKLAVTDGLTGALTHKGFTAMANKELERWRRHGRALGCIVLDIDHFKSINDRFGHAAGDAVLQEIVARCNTRLRSSDIFGRIGGEEFAILLPDSPMAVAIRIAESLRQLIEGAAVTYGNEEIRVSASCGVTTLGIRDGDIKDALARADGALYEAKAGGRNCVRISYPEVWPERLHCDLRRIA
jgi:diguanylate cyclase (GGDEF)-like protein